MIPESTNSIPSNNFLAFVFNFNIVHVWAVLVHIVNLHFKYKTILRYIYVTSTTTIVFARIYLARIKIKLINLNSMQFQHNIKAVTNSYGIYRWVRFSFSCIVHLIILLHCTIITIVLKFLFKIFTIDAGFLQQNITWTHIISAICVSMFPACWVARFVQMFFEIVCEHVTYQYWVVDLLLH